MTSGPVDAISVTEDPAVHRFVISVDGAPAGFAAYRVQPDGVFDFVHTEIGDAFGGRGLGDRLVSAAMESMRDRGAAVRPTCPFVRAWLAKRPAFQELVPAGERGRYGLDRP